MRARFGDRLLYLRKENGFTQEYLAAALNKKYGLELNKSLISRYENNIHEPKFTFIEQVAEFFGVTTDYVMGRKEKRYSNELLVGNVKQIPIFKSILTNQPVFAQEYLEGYEYTESDADFCFRVKGDDMTGARIYDGDIVFVKKQSDVDYGEIAVVLINGQGAALKRVFKFGNKIVLHPENLTMEDMTFSKKDKNMVILGKVKEVKFKAR